jgi:outer membrane protein OmpA-like peptidoglycan-associated protein
MTHRRRATRMATATITGVALCLLAPMAEADEEPLPERAGDFSLKVEPGVAIPLTRPQSRLFDVGFSQSLKALWVLTPYLDLGPSVSVTSLPSDDAVSEAGTAWTFGGGVRLKRPHHAPDHDSFAAISPWLDVDLLYVRTGDLDRPGFDAAVGVAVPVGKSRIFWVGPFARYLHILQGTRTGFDNHDAKILSLGISLEVGSGIRRQAKPAPLAEVREVRVAEPAVTESPVCPDRDQDGIVDSVDRCPDALGPADNWGCPAYDKLVIKADKLELKEKLYFAWDQATLQDVSFPVLDEVAQALKDNKGFRVQVEGHTSSEGANEHNQTLSKQRADAVLAYLVAHGVQKERLHSKGFASSVPLDSNDTAAGRENNRRVEFVVNFAILDGKTK